MHWAPLHTRQAMAIALAAFGLLLVVMLATAPDLATLDLSLGSGSGAVEAAPAAEVERPATERPAWVADPLASPLAGLAAD